MGDYEHVLVTREDDTVTITMRFRPLLGIRWLYVFGMWVSFDGGPWSWQTVRESLSILREAVTVGGS